MDDDDGTFILSLRRQPKGGRQRDKIFEEKRPTHDGIWLIFIHGFRVDQATASFQWKTLRTKISINYSDAGIIPGLLQWPSDQSKFYPRMIKYAEEAGRKLGDYLAQHPGTRTVLVAHSLGARVALEAADYLRGRGVLHGFVLLGAAVSASNLEQFKRYNQSHAKKEAVGYSPADSTLKNFFPLGELVAALYGERGEAVGINGNPESREWDKADSKSNDHSYWKLDVSCVLTRQVLDSVKAGWQPSSWITATHVAAERQAQCQRSSIEDVYHLFVRSQP